MATNQTNHEDRANPVVPQVVLVSSDGHRWGYPGGRTEPGEDWVATLQIVGGVRREVAEEACATITSGRLLGYSRGTCARGPEQGLVLVRAHGQ